MEIEIINKVKTMLIKDCDINDNFTELLTLLKELNLILNNYQKHLKPIQERLKEFNYKSDRELWHDEQVYKDTTAIIKEIIAWYSHLSFKWINYFITANMFEQFKILYEKIDDEIKEKNIFKLSKEFIISKKITELAKIIDTIEFNWNNLDENNNNILYYALIFSNRTMLEFLYTKHPFTNAFINNKNNNGNTALQEALRWEAISYYTKRQLMENIIFLINCPNLDLTTINSKKQNIFHIAAQFGNYEFIKLLLINKQATLLINNLDEYVTPLQWAITGSAYDIKNSPPQALIKPETALRIFLTEIDFNLEVTKEWYTNNTKKCLKTLLLLLENLSEEQINNKDTTGNTCLHEAILQSNFEAAQAILNFNGNINAQNNKKNTALHLAIQVSSYEIIKLLLNHQKIDLSLKNSNNKTAYEVLLTNKKRTDKAILIDLFTERMEKDKDQKFKDNVNNFPNLLQELKNLEKTPIHFKCNTL